MSANFNEFTFQDKSIPLQINKIIEGVKKKIATNEWIDIAPLESSSLIKIATLSELQSRSISEASSYVVSPIAFEVRGLMSHVLLGLGGSMQSKYLATFFETWRNQVALLLNSYERERHDIYREEILSLMLDSLERIASRGLTLVHATHHYLNSSIYSDGHWD
jgi:hypothetical protein